MSAAARLVLLCGPWHTLTLNGMRQFHVVHVRCALFRWQVRSRSAGLGVALRLGLRGLRYRRHTDTAWFGEETASYSGVNVTYGDCCFWRTDASARQWR